MKRAIPLPHLSLLAGLTLLAACGGGATPADKSAFAMLDANQTACDRLVDGVAAAYQHGADAAGAASPASPTAPYDAVRAYLGSAGAEATAEVQAGLPYAEKAIRHAAAE